MSYKSLFTVLTDANFAPETLTAAASIAQNMDAHLDVLCLGVDRSQQGYYYAGATALVLEQSLNMAREDASQLEAIARDHLKNHDCRWGVETGVTQLSEMARHVAARARFSDLAILARPYGPERGIELETAVEAALFEAQTPVIVVPGAAPEFKSPKTITLAWNESSESLNAARAALPLISAADLVRVVVIDPPTHGPNRSDPGGPLSQFLARHGARVEIDVVSKTMPRVSDLLLRHAQDSNSDMIVMGAYGHSRFRESILGGATRHMLEQSELPVFMAH